MPSSQQTPSTQERLVALDDWRAIAILAVLTSHVADIAFGLDQLGPLVVAGALAREAVYPFGTKLFVLVSGIVLALRYGHTLDVREFYKRRFGRIIGPYLVFSALYLAPGLVSGQISLAQAAVRLVTADAEEHLWYIATILQLYLLFPWLMVLYRRLGRQRWVILVLSALVLTMSWESLHVIADQLNVRFAIGGVAAASTSLTRRVFLYRLFGFVAGITLGMEWGRWRERAPHVHWAWRVLLLVGLTLAGAVLILGAKGFLPGLGIAPLALVGPLRVMAQLLVISLLLQGRWSWTAQPGWIGLLGHRLGQLSFGIYLVDGMVRRGLRLVLPALGLMPEQWLYYVVTWWALLVICWLVVQALSYLPGSTYLVGIHLTLPGRKRATAAEAR